MEILQAGKFKGRTYEDVYKNEKFYTNWVKSLENPTGDLFKFKQYVLQQENQKHGCTNIQRTISVGTHANGSKSCMKDMHSTTLTTDFRKYTYDNSAFSDTRVSNGGSMGSSQKKETSNFGNSEMTVIDGYKKIPSGNNTQIKPVKTADINKMNSSEYKAYEEELMNRVRQNNNMIPKALEFDCILIFELYTENSFIILEKETNKMDSDKCSTYLPPELFRILINHQPIKEENGKIKRITFEASKYAFILDEIKRQCVFSGGIMEIPSFVLKSFESFKQFSKIKTLREQTKHVLLHEMDEYTKKNIDRLGELLGEKMERELKPFQIEGVMFGLKNNGRVLIGDEMGLGKTLQALALMAFYQNDWPFIVVCPSSLRFQWKEQALQWLPHLLNEQSISIIKTGKMDIPEDSKMIIISYDLIAMNKKFQEPSYKCIVCDESHYLKNRSAKRTKSLVPIIQNSKRCVLLSGTPALNQSEELYEQVNCILPGLIRYEEFCHRYCIKKIDHKFRRSVVFGGTKHSRELHLFLTNTVMIRRLKSEVMKELPPKIRSKIPVDVSPSDLSLLKKYLKKLETRHDLSDAQELTNLARSAAPLKHKINTLEELRNLKEEVDINVPVLHRLTGLAKVNALFEYISYLVSANVKFILFLHHVDVMNQIVEKVKAQKWKYIHIQGSTSSIKRNELIAKYKNPKENVNIAILSLKACGTGLDLFVASTVVFGELYWVPGDLLQAEDRAHRISSKNPCINIHYMVAQGTFDEMIWSCMNKKFQNVSATLNGEVEDMNVKNIHNLDELNLTIDDQEQIKASMSLVCTPKNKKRTSHDRSSTPNKNTNKTPDIRKFFKKG